MERIVSKDGSEISFSVFGREPDNNKPALVLVHGVGGSSNRWAPVIPLFEPVYQVFALNRRGRLEGDDCTSYSINAEFEDISALVDHVHGLGIGAIYLLGHSFGGICCLEASLLTPHINKMVLYEPPVCGLGVQVYPEGFLEKMELLWKKNDREGMVSSFLTEIVRIAPEEIELFRTTDQWNEELETAHTLPRELRVAVSYQFDQRRFTGMSTETLLLCGSDSLPFFKVAADMIEGGLNRCTQGILPGQQHVAMNTAPELFARTVIDFLC